MARNIDNQYPVPYENHFCQPSDGLSKNIMQQHFKILNLSENQSISSSTIVVASSASFSTVPLAF